MAIREKRPILCRKMIDRKELLAYTKFLLEIKLLKEGINHSALVHAFEMNVTEKGLGRYLR